MDLNYIDKELFFSSENPFPDFQVNKESCRLPMLEMIDRYLIRGKNILSVGSGNAFEEYYFTEFNNSVTLSDADLPYGSIGRWVKRCSSDKKTGLIYDIEDWGKIASKYNHQPTFDVIYISSLHPDEEYRGIVQYSHIKNNLLSVLFTLKTWPSKNFYSLKMESLLPLLKENGLLIIQHYGFSVPIALNTHLSKVWESQFNSYSVRHVETWSFERYTGLMLNVFLKSDNQYFQKYLRKIVERPDIKHMNGRFSAKARKRLQVIKAFFGGELVFKPKLWNRLCALAQQVYRSFRYKTIYQRDP